MDGVKELKTREFESQPEDNRKEEHLNVMLPLTQNLLRIQQI
jgi:hypothetical protein